jgi:hypothetical protein
MINVKGFYGGFILFIESSSISPVTDEFGVRVVGLRGSLDSVRSGYILALVSIAGSILQTELLGHLLQMVVSISESHLPGLGFPVVEVHIVLITESNGPV